LTPREQKLNLNPVMNNTTKRGRGRPKGSTSFISVKLADLINNLGPNAKVSVSKKWVDSIGLALDEEVKPLVSQTPTEDTESIQFQIH